MSIIQQADIRRFDVGTLMLVRTILSEGSITAAARISGVSQPAASNALARCRRAFGDALLVRGPSGMALTARGRILLEQLNDVAPRIEAMTRPPEFVPRTSTAMMALGASDHASLLLIPRLTERITRLAPEVRLAVSLVQAGGSDPERLERAGVDLRLGWLQSLPQSWYTRKLLDDEIGIIVRADAAVTPASIDRAFFLSTRHVALATDRPYYQTLADQALARQGIERKVGVWITNFSAIPLIVAQSDMIAFFPVSIARMYQRFANIKVLPSPVEVGSYNVSMAWHPRIHDDPGYRWLRTQLIAASADLS
ncbi:MAG: LysR family transcriptional regulator [Devosia sp.]